MGDVKIEQRSKDIIERPENWDEMVTKHKEREEEQVAKLMARRKVETPQELGQVASKALMTRATRAAPDFKPLKDHTVLVEPKSEEILNLKQQLLAEITAVSKRALGEIKATTPTPLKGRVSHND